jgi:predicted CXXCH cytochrome family protein
MKWLDRKEGWPERGFSYRPGDDLEATTPIMRPNEIEKQPWLEKALEENPEIFRDFFWPDGMIRVSGREYNGLIESPCYKGGQFSCLSCHSMHKSEPSDMLAKNRADNRACTQCHERLTDERALTEHTHHRADSTGSDCYNCHMPHTTYGVLSAIRSHQVSSPKVADQLRSGRPNACNLCHLDKPLAWTGAQLAEWHGHAQPGLSEEQRTVAESVRLALMGDAGQRALAAWHLGWKPAVEASGKTWITPVLGFLLDDPYAAVRCVASRSLGQVAERTPPGYDFVVSPNSRSAAFPTVFANWSAARSSNAELPRATLVKSENLEETQAAFQSLAAERDERPVRLRE